MDQANEDADHSGQSASKVYGAPEATNSDKLQVTLSQMNQVFNRLVGFKTQMSKYRGRQARIAREEEFPDDTN